MGTFNKFSLITPHKPLKVLIYPPQYKSLDVPVRNIFFFRKPIGDRVVRVLNIGYDDFRKEIWIVSFHY